MHREDFYFKQAVTEAELDQAFEYAEQALFHIMTDQDLIGICQRLVVSEHSPVPDLTVDVTGPGYGYDSHGQRIYAPAFSADLSQDSDQVSTAVATEGNAKYVSLALKFTRVLTDERTDGNSQTVMFLRSESYDVVVTQGEEFLDVPPNPEINQPRAALDPDALLLCDVRLSYGQTQIVNADIDTSRRQDAFVLTSAVPALSVRAGTTRDAIAGMLTSLTNHVLGTAGMHPASAITYAGGASWATGDDNPATTVELQLDKLINDLISTTTKGGTDRVGGCAYAGSPVSLAAGKISAQLKTIVDALNTHLLSASFPHHVRAEGAYVYEGGGSLIESVSTETYTDTTNIRYTLNDLEEGDIVLVTCHLSADASGATSPYLRLRVIDGGVEESLAGTEMLLANLNNQNVFMVARYEVQNAGAISVRLAGKRVAGGSDVGLRGSCVLHMMALR